MIIIVLFIILKKLDGIGDRQIAALILRWIYPFAASFVCGMYGAGILMGWLKTFQQSIMDEYFLIGKKLRNR